MKIIRLVTTIVVCEAIGGLGAIVTTPNSTTWYATLTKPSFSPPSYLFAPVWTALYALMGIALWLIWENKAKNKTAAYTVFFVQLALNLLWSYLFFYFHLPLVAFVEIVLMWIFILASIITFSKISKVAAWLLAPYLAWVTFATALNFAVYYLNK